MNPTDPHARLARVAEAWYRRQWDRFPTTGSQVGLTEYDARLEAPDAALYQAAAADARAVLNEVRSIPAPGPAATVGERLDRKELEAQLELTLLNIDTIGNWRRNPAEPADTVVTSLFYLLMRRDPGSPATAEALASRLEATPAYLAAVRSRVTDPVALWVDVAVEAAEGGAEFVHELAAGAGERHPALAERLKKGAAAAAAGLSDYAAWLKGLDPSKLSTDPAIGRDALTRMVRVNHGLSESLDEIQAYGRSQIDFYKARLAEVAREIDAAATPAEIIARENRRYAESNPDLMADYRRITLEFRDRLVSEGVLDLPPGESCEVISTPAFLRPVLPTAAYSAPGPLDTKQQGIFYVSDPPRSLSPADYTANVAQHFPVEPTCVHEAYPGHHVQLCWANQAPSLIRKLADHIIFMEGWTLYCEQLMIELGWGPNKVFELDYLNSQLWRACRIVIDAGVQSGEMSIEAAVAMLQREVGFTPMRARAELNWYTQSPGTPMSYLLGKGKTLALREKYRAAHPGHGPKEFHRWLLTQGSIPQAWLLAEMGS